MQEFLKPAELPTDIETITDEERFLFRQMGLKMRAFLLVGMAILLLSTVLSHFFKLCNRIITIEIKPVSYYSSLFPIRSARSL